MSTWKYGKKGKKKWMYDFWKEGVRYRRGGFPTQRLARSSEAEERKRVAKTNMGFYDLCNERLEDLEVRRSKKHFEENQKLFKILISLWGSKKEITRNDVEKYLREVAKKRPQKANKHLRLIKALFNFGIYNDLISHNPAKSIERFSITPKDRYVPPLEDVRKVLEVANETQKNYINVVINTMGRIGEVNRLKWSDIYEGYLVLKTRKAKCSDLKDIKIPINCVLRQTLEKIPKVGEYVFINKRTQRPYIYRSKLLKGLCEKAKVRFFSWHCLRHFGANRLSREGVALGDIQRLLGHERISTTDQYLRGLSEGLRQAVQKLEV